MKCLLLFVSCAYAYYVPIMPEQEPFLVLQAGDTADWSQGLVGALLDTSRAVRINARGIHFYDVEVSGNGDGYNCIRSPMALCELNNQSLVLPFSTLPRIKSAGMCIHGHDRVWTRGYYDISACDVFSGMDLLWTNNVLYVDRQLALPTYLYVFVAMLVLFLVISLGQNLTHLLGDKHAPTYPILTEFVCLCLISAITVSHDPWRVWVAHHDQFMFVVLMLYIGCYLLRHAFEIMSKDRFVYTFNVIVACLMLTTARLYGTFETPYATIFLVLLLSRFFHKLHCNYFVFLLACDVLVISFHYYWCFRPSFYDPEQAPIYLLAAIYVTQKIGQYTSQQEAADVAPQTNLVDSVVTKQGQLVTLGANSGNARHDPNMFKLFHVAMQ